MNEKPKLEQKEEQLLPQDFIMMMMLREFADLEKGIGKFRWEAGGWREASTILHATLGNLITHSGTIRRGTAVRSGVSNKKPKPLHLRSW